MLVIVAKMKFHVNLVSRILMITDRQNKVSRRCTRLAEEKKVEKCAFLGCYAASIGNSLPKFRDNL